MQEQGRKLMILAWQSPVTEISQAAGLTHMLDRSLLYETLPQCSSHRQCECRYDPEFTSHVTCGIQTMELED